MENSINWLLILIALSAGFVLGLGTAFMLRLLQAKTAREIADELFRESEGQRKAQLDTVIENVKASFGSMSLDALAKSTEEFLKLAKARLESEREVNIKELDAKKGLIDQQLQRMTGELENVSKLMQDLEKDRIEKFGELAHHLQAVGEQTKALTQRPARCAKPWQAVKRAVNGVSAWPKMSCG